MPSLALNKKATFDYDLLDEIEAGLVLSGPEVKSAKAGHIQLKGAFLDIRNQELWLKNAYIQPYDPATGAQSGYDPYQDRKVLVHKVELKRLIGKKQEQGLTLIPVSVYTKGNLVKLKFALAKGKKKHEKRETIKKRDVQKALKQRMKGDKQSEV